MQSSPEARRWAYPVVAVAAAMVVGDGAALSLGAPGLAPVVALVAALSGVGWIVLAPGARRRWAGAALVAFAVALARADGVYRPFVASDDVAALELPRRIAIEAVVEQTPDRRAGGLRLTLFVTRIGAGTAAREARGRVLLSVRHASQPWARGDRLRGFVGLRRPRNFGNPGEFDYESHLARRGVGVSAFAFDDEDLVRLPGASAGRFATWREGVAAAFDAGAAPAEAALLKALLLGMAGDLPVAMRESFARAGVSHLLAISGLHIGLVAAVAYGSFRWLLARSEVLLLRLVVPRLAAALALVPVFLYAGIAGTNVATIRAVVMAALVMGAVLGQRQANLVVLLALAAVGIIAVDPGVTGEISFQLSFVAVAGLLLVTDAFRRRWSAWEEESLLRLRPRRARALRLVAASVAVSLAALAATTPLVAFHFHRVSLAAPLANLLVTPILGTLVVPLGLLAALLQPLSAPLAGGFVALVAPLVTVGIWLVEAIAALPAASVAVVPPSVPGLLAFYGCVAVVVFAGGVRLRVVAVGALVAGLLVAAVGGPSGRRSDELRVTFLSVGQGDSTVVEFPGGGVMVVDGGGLGGSSFDVGERLIAPFLRSRGVTRVDVLVATHPQWDHFGGLVHLAEEFAPGEIWDNGEGAAGAGWQRFVAAAERSGAQRFRVERGFTRRWGAVEVRALGPPAGAGFGVNDASVVLALEYGGRRVLLPGDVEVAGERALVENDGIGLRSVVLKVPHHGSATSSTAGFVAAVAPEVAVVSAGRDNRFGFPPRAVVNRYRAVDARLVRTDRAGAVTAIIGGDGRVMVETERAGETVIDSM